MQQKRIYQQPAVKVVHFRVEQGFESINKVESHSDNFEVVYENTTFTNSDDGSHDYGRFFGDN